MTRILMLAAVVLATGACASSEKPAPEKQELRIGHYSAYHDITIEVPAGAEVVRAWIAMPSQSDPHQKMTNWKATSPHETVVVHDERGNNFLYFEAKRPPEGTIPVSMQFDIERSEVAMPVDPSLTRPHTPAELAAHAADLAPSSQSVIDDDVRRMAARAVGAERNPVRVARLLYDAVLDHVEYHVKDPKSDDVKTMNSSGKGSSRFTFEQCTGNCTDIHSLYAALARSRDIPTRAVYGSFFKGPLDGVDKDQSYHCWIEFHAPNIGWIPLDVAVADIFVDDFEANEHSRPRAELTVADGYDGPDAALVDYYFGNLDERRVVWHRGRDLVMKNPRQAGPPLLWNPKAYVEIDGKPGKVGRKLTYRSN